MSYDLSAFNMTNTQNLLDVVTAVNNSSDQWFGTLLLLSIYIMSFMLFKKEDAIQDFFTSSFITAIVGVLMLLMGLVSWYVAIVPISLLFFTFMVYFFI